MKNQRKKMVGLLTTLTLIGGITGCAATQTVIEHGRLAVETQQSKTIFLDPVSEQEKTIFISIKNNT